MFYVGELTEYNTTIDKSNEYEISNLNILYSNTKRIIIVVGHNISKSILETCAIK